MKQIGNLMNILDTIGFNDPQKTRSDEQILETAVHTIQTDPEISRNGIAGLIQCVMVPKSGRIQKSAIELMSKFLQVFTLSYPDSDG